MFTFSLAVHLIVGSIVGPIEIYGEVNHGPEARTAVEASHWPAPRAQQRLEDVRALVDAIVSGKTPLYEGLGPLSKMPRDAVIADILPRLGKGQNAYDWSLYKMLSRLRAAQTPEGLEAFLAGMYDASDVRILAICVGSLAYAPNDQRDRVAREVVARFDRFAQDPNVLFTALRVLSALDSREAAALQPQFNRILRDSDAEERSRMAAARVAITLQGVTPLIEMYPGLDDGGKKSVLLEFAGLGIKTKGSFDSDEAARTRLRALILGGYSDPNLDIRKSAMMSFSSIFGPSERIYSADAKQLAINQQVRRALQDQLQLETDPVLRQGIVKALTNFEADGRLKKFGGGFGFSRPHS